MIRTCERFQASNQAIEIIMVSRVLATMTLLQTTRSFVPSLFGVVD